MTPSNEWPTYGHDAGGQRFSPLTQVTPANVDRLQVAWVYHMRPAPSTDSASTPGAGQGRGGGRGGSGFASSETTPIVVDGLMYLTTPYGRVVALDSTTGKEIWNFRVPAGERVDARRRILAGRLADASRRSYSGQAAADCSRSTRKRANPTPAFGDHGSVDLNTPEILQGLAGTNGLSSPPTMYRNLIITGGRTQENPPQGPAGDVRAWDVHTGKLVWTFHSIPRAGEKYNDTWAGDSWKNRSGVNVWGFITVDVERGIVYMPFGAPSVDQYGGDRPKATIFSERASSPPTRIRESTLWHFQVVHHDIWDADLSGAPALIDVKQGGRTIPAVAIINKPGLLFLLDRVTGKPIYGVEERPVPASEVPLERAAKTQPFPSETRTRFRG